MATKKKELYVIEGDRDAPVDATNGADMASNDNDVGSELRRAREARNIDIERASRDLKIRGEYLDALEQSKVYALPGVPYAIGFLRTYAEYLDLDVTEMVRRFKAEITDMQDDSDLVFPKPVKEGRLPGRALGILSIVLMAAAYGGYYLYSHSGDDAKPSATAATPNGAKKTASAAISSSTPKTAATKAPPVTPVTKSATKKPAEPKIAKAPSPAATTPQPAKKPAAIAGAAPNTGATDVKPAPPAKTVDKTAAKKVVKTAAVKKPTPVEQPKTGKTKTGKTKAGKSKKDKPKQVAALPGGARIQLRAKAKCWVQIRERNGRNVIARVMRKGEKFIVPNKPGLIMHVGNAGGLEVTLDGKVLKPLGPPHLAIRYISLDPKRLVRRR